MGPNQNQEGVGICIIVSNEACAPDLFLVPRPFRSLACRGFALGQAPLFHRSSRTADLSFAMNAPPVAFLEMSRLSV